MCGENRVHVLDSVQRLEHRIRLVPEPVVVKPLEIANPDHDLRELVGVVVDLDAVQLGRANAGEKVANAIDCGEGDDFLLQVEQEFEGDVQEVTATARGVKDS